MVEAAHRLPERPRHDTDGCALAAHRKTAVKLDFRARLEQRFPILFDGAMGTMLYERGIFLNRVFEEVCLSDPRLVLFSPRGNTWKRAPR